MITVISVAGVAAGVMALIISLAVNNGFRNTLQSNLLAATAHVNILEKERARGSRTGASLNARFRSIPHVVAVAPVLYDEVLVTGPHPQQIATLKGIESRRRTGGERNAAASESGLARRLADDDNGLPGIILGAKLAQDTGSSLNSVVTVISPQGTSDALRPAARISGSAWQAFSNRASIDVDDKWAYASLHSVQKLLSVGDVVNSIEMRLDDMDPRPRVAEHAARLAGPEYAAITWEEQNSDSSSARSNWNARSRRSPSG